MQVLFAEFVGFHDSLPAPPCADLTAQLLRAQRQRRPENRTIADAVSKTGSGRSGFDGTDGRQAVAAGELQLHGAFDQGYGIVKLAWRRRTVANVTDKIARRRPAFQAGDSRVIDYGNTAQRIKLAATLREMRRGRGVIDL